MRLVLVVSACALVGAAGVGLAAIQGPTMANAPTIRDVTPGSPKTESSIEMPSIIKNGMANPNVGISVLQAEQAELAAQPEATKHAEAAVTLLGIHEGDEFPLDHPNGISAADFERAMELDGQAEELITENTSPSNASSKDPMATGFKEQARQLRQFARREATAEAIVYAIRREPQAWRKDGGYLKSAGVWIWLGDGPKCLEFGDRYLAGDGEFKCSEHGTDLQDAIYRAASAWGTS